jgi:hypothetical protein
MREYDKEYKVKKENGRTYYAYFRKGEDYDWWQETETNEEVNDVVEHFELTEWTKEQNEIIGQKFDGLMDSVFNLVDELYKKDEVNLTKGEQKFFEAFHEYIEALSDDDEEVDED